MGWRAAGRFRADGPACSPLGAVGLAIRTSTPELAACLKDKAYDARSVAAPVQSKMAGIIAQCEVDVDRFEGGMPFGGATGSEDQRAAAERLVEEEAAAAVLAYQPCAAR